MTNIEGQILNTIYQFYPQGIIPGKNYYSSPEVNRLRDTVASANENLWNLFISQIQETLQINIDNRKKISAFNPCFIFLYDMPTTENKVSTFVFHLSLISNYYCFYIKTAKATDDDSKQFIDHHLENLKQLSPIERDKALYKLLHRTRQDLFKLEIIWNTAAPYFGEEYFIIQKIISQHYPLYRNISNDFLFDVVPNIATISKPYLNSVSVFDALFIDYLVI